MIVTNTCTPVDTRYLANIVCADGGDGLEGQLLAADTHEDLLHLAQEILHMCTDRNMKGMQTGWRERRKINVKTVKTD